VSRGDTDLCPSLLSRAHDVTHFSEVSLDRRRKFRLTGKDGGFEKENRSHRLFLRFTSPQSFFAFLFSCPTTTEAPTCLSSHLLVLTSTMIHVSSLWFFERTSDRNEKSDEIGDGSDEVPDFVGSEVHRKDGCRSSMRMRTISGTILAWSKRFASSIDQQKER